MENKKKIRWIISLILSGFFFKLFRFLFKRDKITCLKDNFKVFLRKEEREVSELSRGRESFKKYCHDSGRLFKDYFIPHDGNNHKPKILHARSLAFVVLALVVIKIAVTGYLFFVYPNQGKMAEQMTTEILRLINEDRAGNDLGPLAVNDALSASALAKAEDMSINDYFAHYSPDGKKPWDWISRSEYAYLFVGENLAINFTSAKSVHNALMASPSHKKNILNGRYQDVGLAVISGEIDGKRTNILVQLFGSRKAPQLVTAAATDTLAGSTAVKTAAPETAKPSAPAPVKSEPATPPPPPAPVREIVVESGGGKLPPASEPEDAEREIALGETERTGEPPVDTLASADERFARPEEPETAAADAGPELENSLNTELRYYEAAKERRIGIATSLIKGSKYVYLGVLALIIAALFVNIVVRIGIQHKPIIAQTLAVIVFIVGLLSVHVHILEDIAEKVAVL